MSTEKIETIETIESSDPPKEHLNQAKQENAKEVDIFDDTNEYYLSVLYQMCVAA